MSERLLPHGDLSHEPSSQALMFTYVSTNGVPGCYFETLAHGVLSFPIFCPALPLVSVHPCFTRVVAAQQKAEAASRTPRPLLPKA